MKLFYQRIGFALKTTWQLNGVSAKRIFLISGFPFEMKTVGVYLCFLFFFFYFYSLLKGIFFN
jgi:hypothetical protein